MDLSRHSTIFTPEMLSNTPVHVIGCGATGSSLAFSLCKLGVPKIYLYDADKVESHNIANQMFRYTDVDKNKAEALKERLDVMLSYPETKIEAVPEFVTKESGHMLRGIIFNVVDSMEARKEIYEAYVKANFSCEHYIETRMGLKMVKVYSINGTSKKECDFYEKTLHSDKEVVETSACGTTQTAFPTANLCAQTAVWAMLGRLNKMEVPNEIVFDVPSFNVMTNYVE